MINENMVFYLICNLFRTYTIYLLCSCFLHNFKGDKKYEFLAYLPFFALVSIVYLTECIPVLNFVANVVGLIIVAFFYDEKWKKCFWVLILSYLLMVIVETMVVVIFSENTLSVWKIAEFEYDTLYLVLAVIITFIATIIFRYRYGKRERQNITGQFSAKDWMLLLIIPVYVIYITIMLFSDGELRKSLILVSVILSLVVVLMVFYLYEELLKTMQDRIEKKNLEEQNKYYENQLHLMQEAESRVRTLRHDMKNHMTIIRNMLIEGDIDTANTYLGEVIGLVEGIKEISKTGIMALDSVLNYKLGRLEELGVKVKANIAVPDRLFLKNNEWTIILGNLLDNAGEALEKVQNNREISVNVKYVHNNINIIIRNTYDGNVNVEKGKLLTTKKDKLNHGIGLESVSSVVNSRDGSMTINHEGTFFEVKIIIPEPIGDV